MVVGFVLDMAHIMIHQEELEKDQHRQIWKFQNTSLLILTQLKLDDK